MIGSLRVFEAAASAGARVLVHASSVGAYSPGPEDNQPVDESWPTHALPTAAYGREKAYVERALDAFELVHPDVRVVRMRPCFIFKAEAAEEQRRIFAGPLVPSRVVGRVGLPLVPAVPGLSFQALHTDDVADAYRRVLTGDAKGAFNLASDPVITPDELAQVFGARATVPLPARALVAGARLAFRARVSPAPPELVELFLSLPLLDWSRAQRELGWKPERTGIEALEALREGWRTGAGFPTPPLSN